MHRPAPTPAESASLTVVVCGPHYYSVHPGVEPRYHDKNFAAFFPVLDLVFGTYQAPETGVVPATGCPKRVQGRGALEILPAMLGIDLTSGTASN